MIKYTGKCLCEDVRLELNLPQKINLYTARECDCDFCVERSLKYLSDPKGYLSIFSKKPLEKYKQGSKQAEFLACSECKQVIAASLPADKRLIGSLNANLLSVENISMNSESISPKSLSAEEKFNRWQQFWMPIIIKYT